MAKFGHRQIDRDALTGDRYEHHTRHCAGKTRTR
jgi:hypothetical protein